MGSPSSWDPDPVIDEFETRWRSYVADMKTRRAMARRTYERNDPDRPRPVPRGARVLEGRARARVLDPPPARGRVGDREASRFWRTACLALSSFQRVWRNGS